MTSNHPTGVPGGRIAGGEGQTTRRRGRGRGGNVKRGDFKIPLIFAIVLATAAFGLFVMLGQSAVETPELHVVVAARNLTAYHELTADDLTTVSMDPAFFEYEVEDVDGVTYIENRLDQVFSGGTPEEALASVQLELGKTTLYPISGGEFLYADDLTLTSKYADVTKLDAEHRLMSIEAMPASAAGGVIKPGERVDVVIVDTSFGVATTMFEDVEVVAVHPAESALESIYSTQIQDPALDTANILPSDPYPGIYTLKVPAEDTIPLGLAANAEGVTVVLSVRSDAANREADAAAEQQQAAEEGEFTGAEEIEEIIEEPPAVIDVLDLFCDIDRYRTELGEEIEQFGSEVVIDLPDACRRMFEQVTGVSLEGEDPFAGGTDTEVIEVGTEG